MARSSRKQRFLRIVCFVVAFASIMSTSFVYTFSIFLSSLKATFRFSQTQVEFVMSMTFVGLGGTFPVGLFVQRYGVRAGAVLGLILPTAAYFFIWRATQEPAYYSQHEYILAGYFFVGGVGSGAVYITAMTATLRNYERKYYGRISGAIISAYNLGVCFYFLIYEYLFINAHIDDPENQDLGGYFLFTACLSGAVNAIGPFVYGYYPNEENIISPEDDEVFLTDEESILIKHGVQKSPVTSSTESKQEMSLWQILTSSKYHYLIWPSVIMMAFEPVNVGNLSIYLYSFELEEYAATLPYISPGLSLFMKLFFGWLSDSLLSRVHRCWWVLLASVLKLLTYFLGLFLLDHLSVLVLSLILWDVSVVLTICVMPALMAEEYGTRMFASTWGLSYLATASLTFLLQLAFGLLYDVYATEDSMCYGIECFGWSFFIGIIFCVLSVICTTMYIRKKELVLWRPSEYTQPHSDG